MSAPRPDLPRQGDNNPVANPVPSAGIYIHIPFCKVKCPYCDFYSLADRDEAMDRLVNCLVNEIRSVRSSGLDLRFDTLFIGGGTPSLLSPAHLEQILTALQTAIGLDNVEEFTLEANPGEAPEDKLRDFRSLGVNRLSMGFQSFDTALLQFLGRLHGPQACIDTFEAARRAGFENINADLMFNIPGQSLSRWQADLKTLANLEPEHISAYSLTVETGTPLHDWVAAGEVTMPPEDTDVSMFSWVRDYLPRQGYKAYEVSNYARGDRTCRHNLHYWRIEPYLGLGPSAHGFDGSRRTWNIRSLDGYMEAVEAGRSSVAGGEQLSQRQLHNERLAFGLRLSEGLSVTEDLGYSEPRDFVTRFQAQLERYEGQLVLSGDRLALTARGLMLADAIAADLMLAAGPVPELGFERIRVRAGS